MIDVHWQLVRERAAELIGQGHEQFVSNVLAFYGFSCLEDVPHTYSTKIWNMLHENVPESPVDPLATNHPDTKSPIESRLLKAILDNMPEGFTLETQLYIAGYCVDFALTKGGIPFFVIEADGHEFHENRARAAKDRKRDRDMLMGGIIPMRFTGSEIHRDAARCAHEIQRVVKKWRKKHVCF